MNLDDLLQETWSALTANRARSSLTILGIVIGIGAVITMNAIIGGVQLAQSQMLGANASRLVDITLKGLDGFDMDDLEALEQNVPGYDYIVPTTNEAQTNVTVGAKKLDGHLKGAGHKFFEAYAYNVLAGEIYSQEDDDNALRVVVISQRGAKALFGGSVGEAVGKGIKIRGDEYRVVAVVDKINNFEEYYTNAVFGVVPYNTACVRLTGETSINNMDGMTSEGVDLDSVMADTQAYLAKRYKLTANTDVYNLDGAARSVTVDSNKSTIESLKSSMASFQMIMVTVSGISLLVGGIGIMNMMLTNVTERIREIGLRKALGAKRADVTGQFMLESVCLCLAGGIIGVVLGIAGAYGLGGVVAGGMSDMMVGMSASFQPVIDVTSIVNAVLVCTVTGLLFGWYPARRAARLDPVESLNHQ